MKYTKSEEKKVNYHRREIERYEKMIIYENKRFEKLSKNHNDRIKEIRKYKDTERSKISTINDKLKKRCKHKGERTRWRNNRDDASFEYFIGCADCGEILWDECK